MGFRWTGSCWGLRPVIRGTAADYIALSTTFRLLATYTLQYARLHFILDTTCSLRTNSKSKQLHQRHTTSTLLIACNIHITVRPSFLCITRWKPQNKAPPSQRHTRTFWTARNVQITSRSPYLSFTPQFMTHYSEHMRPAAIQRNLFDRQQRQSSSPWASLPLRDRRWHTPRFTHHAILKEEAESRDI